MTDAQQELAYNTYHAVYDLNVKLDELIGLVRELVALESEGAWRNEKMLEMQTEMFKDYKEAKDRAHVKLQGDMEGDHASPHTA